MVKQIIGQRRVLASALLLTALVLLSYLALPAQANLYGYGYIWLPPPKDAIPLAITVLTPENGTKYRVNEVTLNFTLDTWDSSMSTLYDVHFKASWLQNNATIFKYNASTPLPPHFLIYNQTFMDLPDGNYSIVITAVGWGAHTREIKMYNEHYENENTHELEYRFVMDTTQVVNFTIATQPKVRVCSPQNFVYNTSSVTLDFGLDEEPSRVQCSLDNQENITLGGNTTLTGLPNGAHNITVYAWDLMGNAGASETTFFTVNTPEPFPIVTVGAALVVILAVDCIVIFVYLRKRKV